MKKTAIVLCVLFALGLLIGCGEEPQRLEGQEYRTFQDFLFWCFVSFWRWLGLVSLIGAVAGTVAVTLRGGGEWIENITKSVRGETKRIDELNRRIEELTEEIRKLRSHTVE